MTTDKKYNEAEMARKAAKASAPETKTELSPPFEQWCETERAKEEQAPETRKFIMGGFVLPLRTERTTRNGTPVVDAQGRFIKRFASVDMANEFVKKAGNPIWVPLTPASDAPEAPYDPETGSEYKRAHGFDHAPEAPQSMEQSPQEKTAVILCPEIVAQRDQYKASADKLAEALREAADWLSRSTRIDDQEQAQDARAVLSDYEKWRAQ